MVRLRKPSVSVIIATRDRPDALYRCLRSWRKQKYHGKVEYILVDDSSVDFVHIELTVMLSLLKPIKIVRISGSPLRCPAPTWNEGYHHAHNEFVVFTGHDIILGSHNTLSQMVAQYSGERRISVMTYFLTECITDRLCTLDWLNNPQTLEKQLGFWEFQGNDSLSSAGLQTYLTGQSREQWEWFGLFRETGGYSEADSDVVRREQFLGRGVDTVKGIRCYHQWHLPFISHANLAAQYIYRNEHQARLLEAAEQVA